MLIAYASDEHTGRLKGGSELGEESAAYQRALHSPPAT